MRLTFRARQVLALAVVVLLVVVASTVAHLANVARLALGAAVDEGELMAKQLELLTELVPRAELIALIVNPSNVNAERDSTPRLSGGDQQPASAQY